MRIALLVSLLLITLAATALPENPSARMTAILDLPVPPAEMRARLLACADSAKAARDIATDGEACALAASSYEREGIADSAILCHRRALARLASDQELSALVDQLLYRHGPGDVAEATGLLETATQQSDIHDMVGVTGRLAWARFLAGQTDSAATLFATMKRHLQRWPEWRYRMAKVAFARKDYHLGVDMLLPEAVRSRGTDQEVVDMLEEAGKATGMLPRFKDEVTRRVYEQDRSELDLANGLGGRLVATTASDGFPLGGLVVPVAAKRPAASRASLAVLVLVAPGDTLASGDSLAAALRRHGVTTCLFYPRGWGSSVGPECPGPDAWFNLQSLLQARVARDFGDVFRVVSRMTRVDSTRYVVAAEGRAATMAVLAAADDPRVKAMLLVSPSPAAVDRGVVRAEVARLRLPVFFQISPEEYAETFEISDVLYQAGNRAASRVVEAKQTGHGLTQFRSDSTLAPRFVKWLDATMAPPRARRGPASPAPRSPRPAPHRRG